MNKNFFTALAIAPAFCMSVYADATTDAKALLEQDRTLAQHPLLAARVQDAFSIEGGLIS